MTISTAHDAGTLSLRSESAQSEALRRFIATARKLRVATPHELLEVAGGVACFFGKGGPLNVARGFTAHVRFDDAAFASIERFFARWGEPVRIDTAPSTSPALLAMLRARGAQLTRRLPTYAIDLRRPSVRGVAPESARCADPAFRIEAVDESTAPIAADVVGRGFNEGKPGPPSLIDFARVNFAIARSAIYLARYEGVPVAGGRVSWMDVPRVHGGGRVAILNGASTLPEFRGRGAQGALLRARLARARNVGCDTAFVTCNAGTPSERNIVRAGFSRAYDLEVFTVG